MAATTEQITSFTFGDLLSSRTVIGQTLKELGQDHHNLWVLTPDIGATLVEFRDTYPDRFVDVGLSEQACVGIAAGLAAEGNIPVVSGMLPFLSMRALEQVRSDICYPNLPVKIVGTAAGNTTFWKVRNEPNPSERADLTNSGSTDSTPLMVLSRTGQMQA